MNTCILKNKQSRKLNLTLYRFALLFVFITVGVSVFSQRLMESLDRGLVAVKTEDSNVFLSWRKLATDASDIAFNIYRDGVLVNSTPISDVSNYVDSEGTTDDYYYLEIVNTDGVVGRSEAVIVWENQYKEIPLQVPEGGEPNDISVADLDGDGEYELVVKIYGEETKDNSQSGFSDPEYLQAYELNGTLLWTIDLGVNIRAGSHYTQFMVYDLDGDGKAEMACKTAPGTIDGTGTYLSDGPAATDDDAADYRNSNGYILEGPEYLTLFDGETGKEISTVDYVPGRGVVADWGDSYGNRVDRFLGCVAYLDGQNPSLVMCRGYYTRTVLAAWDYENGELVQRWVFDTDNDLTGQDGVAYEFYAGQGAHSLSVGDVDGDGADEIVYGAMAVDNDGTGLWSTGNNHGDATHLGDFDADHTGLEYFMPSESAHGTNKVTGGEVNAVWFAAAGSGDIIWYKNVDEKSDIGRGMVDDITSDNPGCEFWAYGKAYSPSETRFALGIYDDAGNDLEVTSEWPSINFASWWDGDLTREVLSGTTITKWSTTTKTVLLETEDDCLSNNSTKATPCISGDILGDWREEVIWRTADNQSLRIYTTTEPTTAGIYTLVQDPQYRLALTWQNTGYNQPPHPSFFIGDNMPTPPTPSITMVDPVVDPFIQIVDPIVDYELELGRSVYINLTVVGFADNSTIVIKEGDVTLATLTEAPYIAKIDGLLSGTHTIVASGYDGDSNLVESEALTITVDEGYPHVTSFTSPADGSVYLIDETIDLSVDAYDSDGTIANVDFYFNDQIVASLTEAPYTTNVANPGYGAYEVKAVITDDLGNSTESEIHSINVGLLTFIQEDERGYCGFNTLGWIESTNGGFTGTGYANTDNAADEGVNWAITIPEDGAYTFLWKYATSTDRPGNLFINDIQEGETLTFAASGAWTTWIEQAADVNLTAGNYKISLVATTSGGLGNIDYFEIISKTGSAAVALDCESLATGIESTLSLSEETVNVYPNPASQTLYVKVLNDVVVSGNMMIYDLAGNLVLQDNYYTGENKFDISTLKRGIYLLKLNSNSGAYIQKLIVE